MAAIASGGGAGAGARWAVSDVWPGRWAIFVINAAGCLTLGMLLAWERRVPRRRIALRDFGAIGFCGGLTTMSTFAVDVVSSDSVTAGIAYAALSVVAGIVCVIAGAGVVRDVGAVESPVEREP